MNVKTYALLEDVITKNNNKTTIQNVAKSFLSKGLNKSIATRVFTNINELNELDMHELILFSEALHGATKNSSIRLSRLFSEDELKSYYQDKNKDYEEYLPKHGELAERQLKKLEFLNATYGNKKMKQMSYYIYLAHIKDDEDLLDKDLYDFNEYEIVETMQGVIGSISTKNNTLSFIRHYLDWCVEQKIVSDNVVRYMDSSKLITVNKGQIANDYIDIVELNNELTWLVDEDDIDINEIDVMIALLVRSGLAVKDIVKLRNSDFDHEKNIVKLKTNQGFKMIKLENFVLRWVDIAHTSSGKIPRTRHVLKTLDDHIIKLTTNEYSEEQALFSIRRRLAKFKEVGFRPINENILITSRKIDMLDNIVNEKGALTIDDFKRVQTHFGNSPASYYKLKTEYQATRGEGTVEYKYSKYNNKEL